MCNLFLKGEDVQLAEMLNARENRQQKQWEILKLDESAILVSITMNIPGNIKVIEELTQIFKIIFKKISALLKDTVLLEKYYIYKTGHEGYFLVKGDPIKLKKKLINIEETDEFGRLFDLDILFLEQEQLKLLSRQDFKLTKRTCFVCQTDAKICGRDRSHSVEELQLAISDYINERRSILND